MNDWDRLFTSAAGSAVYTAVQVQSLPEIERAARSHGLIFFHIDLAGVSTKEGFLEIASQALQFPDYFGMNWDAFEECLTDLSWSPGGGYVIVFNNIEDFAKNARLELNTARKILKLCASLWKKQNTPFYVLIVAKHAVCG
jgi:RNAse (barnase) inhibitor barstar